MEVSIVLAELINSKPTGSLVSFPILSNLALASPGSSILSIEQPAELANMAIKRLVFLRVRVSTSIDGRGLGQCQQSNSPALFFLGKYRSDQAFDPPPDFSAVYPSAPIAQLVFTKKPRVE